jgi:hypothetical protein
MKVNERVSSTLEGGPETKGLSRENSMARKCYRSCGESGNVRMTSEVEA